MRQVYNDTKYLRCGLELNTEKLAIKLLGAPSGRPNPDEIHFYDGEIIVYTGGAKIGRWWDTRRNSGGDNLTLIKRFGFGGVIDGKTANAESFDDVKAFARHFLKTVT